MTAGPLAAVVLAAGASTRLGRPKQLVVLDGLPLVRRAALAAHAAVASGGGGPVIVVLGAHAAAVAPALDGLAGTVVVTHAGWADGLAASLGAGVRAALAHAPGSDGLLLTVADQPSVDARALGTLIAAFDGPRRLVAAAYRGVVGVPAIVGREHASALLGLTGDAGAGRWLRARGAAVTAVPLPEAAIDVDTEADVAALAGAPDHDRRERAGPDGRAAADPHGSEPSGGPV